MEIIRQTHIEEQKATLKKEDFIISEEIKTTKTFKPFQLSSWLTLSGKYWSIIGVSGPVAIAIILAIICKCTMIPKAGENHTIAIPKHSHSGQFIRNYC